VVVGATQNKFLFFVKFAVVHAIGVLLASIFAFFAVFAVLGLLMALLPPRAFKRASAYARGLVVVYLVTLLCTTFAVPGFLRQAPAIGHGLLPLWSLLLPSTWFLGLCQSWRDRADPVLTALAKLALPGVAAIVSFAFCAYAAGYQRHFVSIAETTESSSVPSKPRISRMGVLLDRLFRSAFQRGGFRFVCKTLLRSESHRLMLTAVAGLGLVLASQALLDAFEGAKSWREAALSPDGLSIPFILAFLMIVGLRIVFEIPAELRSNWIFQLMLDPDGRECEHLARRVILILVLPWLLAISLPAYAYLESSRVACLHTLLVVTWAVLLTNIVLIRFRKLPFTCTMPVFKQHSFVTLISVGFGFLLYAGSTPEFESSALAEPLRMLSLVPVAVVAWYIPHHLAKSSIEIERRLIFEESATQTIEALRLGD
jgi:hypothetical protein